MNSKITSNKDAALVPSNLINNPTGKFSDAERMYQGIPTIERTPKGRLLAAFYSGGIDEGPGNFIILVKSDDDGKSFSGPIMAIENPSPECRNFDPCLWLDPLGRLWFFYAQSYAYYDGRLGVWAALCEEPDAPELRFSKPRRIANGIMMNKPTVLKNGDWLLCCAIWSSYESEYNYLPEERYSNVYRSKNQGVSFELIGHADYAGRNIDEHMIVERNDGSLWMLIRSKKGIGQAFSNDKGVNWFGAEDSDLGGPWSRFCIRRLKSGNLILINHYKFTRRNNLTAMISKDDGKTWQGALMLDERDEVSYPDMTEGENGLLYIIYDRKRYADKEILMAVVTEEDILQKKLVTPGSRLKVLVNKAYGKQA